MFTAEQLEQMAEASETWRWDAEKQELYILADVAGMYVYPGGRIEAYSRTEFSTYNVDGTWDGEVVACKMELISGAIDYTPEAVSARVEFWMPATNVDELHDAIDKTADKLWVALNLDPE